MIYYLVQSSSSQPELSLGVPPHGLLNAAELRHFEALHFQKRRHDWLLGRWTAKHLLQEVAAQECGEYYPLDSFTVFNSPSGAPLLTCPRLLHMSLSISHRDQYGFAAVVLHPDARRRAGGVGADIEHVEPRSDAFIQDYLTEAEIAQVNGAPDYARDQIVASIWSAKEAGLKALHLGLTVDSRSISCSGIKPRTNGSPVWTTFELCYLGQTLSRTVELVGWCRTFDDYVLVIVAERQLCASSNEIVEMDLATSPILASASPVELAA